MRVLIAEDNQFNQQLMTFNLRRLNWEYVLVCDGVQAVEACRDSFFDLVLMDVDMPVMDGIQATRNIRKFNSGIPVIAVTAYTDEAARKECFESGMNGFVAKPCSREDILAAVSSILQIKVEKVA